MTTQKYVFQFLKDLLLLTMCMCVSMYMCLLRTEEGIRSLELELGLV